MCDLTIGLPVYNARPFIREAIRSLQSQTYSRFRVIISDNASTDETSSIIASEIRGDHRFTYLRQAENIGAGGNFLFVSRNIETPFFAWLASDDVISPDYLSTCVRLLQENQKIGLSFTGMNNIDSYGRVIRTYPHLTSLGGERGISTIARYIWSPEAMGKANFIYGVYRTPVVMAAIQQVGFPVSWGGDMAFVLSVIIKGGGIAVSPDVLFHKRAILPWERPDVASPIPISNDIIDLSYPVDHFEEYRLSLYDAARGSKYYSFVKFLTELRHRRLLNSLRRRHDTRYSKNYRRWILLRGGSWLSDAIRSYLSAFG